MGSVTRCRGKNARRCHEKFVRLNRSESVFRCRENSAERCQVRLALKFLCCSVFRCANLAYHASPCSLESSFPLTLFPSSKKASDEVVYLCRDLLLSELAFKDSIIKLSDKRFFKLSDK